MIRRFPIFAVLGAVLIVTVMVIGCAQEFAVQPSPENIEDYFDAVYDEPDDLLDGTGVDLSDIVDPACFCNPDGYIFATDFYWPIIRKDWTYWSLIPKSLIERGTDFDEENGEILYVHLPCEDGDDQEVDIIIMNILNPSGGYTLDDFYGVLKLDPDEAGYIRNNFAPTGICEINYY